jgi:hypothetical protein
MKKRVEIVILQSKWYYIYNIEKGVFELKLYHVSTLLEDKPTHFIPRVPSSRMNGEDEVKPRICFSSDVKEALKSMPDSYDGIYNKYYRQEEEGLPALFSLFEVDTQDVGVENLIDPTTLTNEKLVPDAVKHQEYWVTKELVLTPANFILIEHLEQNNDDCQFTEVRVQYSKESVERTFVFTFIYEAESTNMKVMLKQMQLPFEEVIEEGIFNFGEGKFELTVVIPSDMDIANLWLYYYLIRFQYEEELGMNDYKQLLKESKPFGENKLVTK